MCNILKTLLLFTVFSLSSCTFFNHGINRQGPVKVSDDWDKPGIQIIRLSTTKEKLRELNQGRLTGKVRLVPLTKTDAGSNPEYRIFNCIDGSTPYEIGLRNADILVAVEGFAVFSPSQFGQYLSILSERTDSTIEIKREGKPLKIELKVEG